MKKKEIYNKLPNDSLDKWTKINIIKKLKSNEKNPKYKTPHVSKMDNQYIDEIISLSQNIIHELSKLYPVLEIMKKKQMTVDDLLELIASCKKPYKSDNEAYKSDNEAYKD